MNNFLLGFIFGLTIGFLIGILTVGVVQQYEYIEPCEKDLPRTERCVITAIQERKYEIVMLDPNKPVQTISCQFDE